MKKVEFTNNKDNSTRFFYIDYYDTCNDITNMLADEFESEYEGITPFKINLYDCKKSKIDDFNRPLGSIQKFGIGFYFKIINIQLFLSPKTEP